MWQQTPLRVALIKIVCCSCLHLGGRQYAWCGGPPLPLSLSAFRGVNKPQVARRTAGRRSVRPAETSCRPCCVQVTALTLAASPPLFANFLFFISPGRDRASTSLANSMNAYRCFLSEDICCKYCDTQSNKLPPWLLSLCCWSWPGAFQTGRGGVPPLAYCQSDQHFAQIVQPRGVIELSTEVGGLTSGVQAKWRSISWSVSS